MKTTLIYSILASLLAFSNLAKAGNEGPQAFPPPPPPNGVPAQLSTPVAHLNFFSGFMMPNKSLQIEITSDGKAFVVRGKPATRTLLIELAPPVMKELTEDIAKVESAELVTARPDAPQCQDAPTTNYIVVKDGAEIRFAEYAGCQLFTRSPRPAGDLFIQRTLEAVLALVDQTPENLKASMIGQVSYFRGVYPGACMTTNRTIYKTGSVIQDQCGENVRMIMLTSDAWVNYVSKNARNLKSMQLVKRNPSQPQTAGGGGFYNSAVNAAGELVLIDGVVEQAEMVRPSAFTDGSGPVKEAFKQLNAKLKSLENLIR